MGDKYSESQAFKNFIKLKNALGSEDVFYSVFYEDIPNEFKDIASKELNETEENKRTSILTLRKFLAGENISEVEDYILITVLRNCKYDVKKSKSKLINYLQTQDRITKWLQTADLKRVESVLIHNFVGFLPYRDRHGRVIMYTTPYSIDYELFTIEEMSFCSLCLLLYVLSYPLTSISGITYIGESKTSFSILYPIVKEFIKLAPTILSYPFRVAKVDVLNENFIVKWGFKFARPIIPSKIYNRIQFHGNNLQDLQNVYHPAFLPEEFGGTMGPINPKFFLDDFLNFINKLKSRNLFLLE